MSPREKLIEEGKDLAKSLGKDTLAIRDLAEKWLLVQKCFGSLQNFLISCGLKRTRRPPKMDTDQMKAYLNEIKNIKGTCWTTDKYYADKRYLARTLMFDGKRYMLHRLSFILHKGAIPAKCVIMHLCDNEECFNPEHLEAGSQKENIQHCYDVGRHPRVGKQVPRTVKLNRIGDPYDYQALLKVVKDRVTITSKNEWLYRGKIPKTGYPVIVINYQHFVLPRLLLANKLGKKYEDIIVTRHILPDGSQPQKHDVNPDHLLEGSFTENANDALAYKKNVLLDQEKADNIRESFKTWTGKIKDFDIAMSKKYDVAENVIQRARLGITFNSLEGKKLCSTVSF